MERLFTRSKLLKLNKMTLRIVYIVALICLCAYTSLPAQETKDQGLPPEKIRGSRFSPYPNYPGSPFLNEKFLIGEIELSDGQKIGGVGLNYGTYRDELIYYNSTVAAQIVVDKASLNGFSFTDSKGRKRIFRRQFFKGYFQGDCFFEVLSDGEISVLAYRKVNLEACDTYYSKTGMAYQPAYIYYFYSPQNGYDPVKISRSSLLSKYAKPDQKIIKKTLRKNNVIITDEISFVKAWKLIDELGLKPIWHRTND